MFNSLIQILLLIFLPIICIHLTRKLQISNWLSPVVCCYAIGIILANTTMITIDSTINTLTSQATVLLAIPLLLYSTDLLGWLQYAKKTILSFSLCVVSGIFISVGMAFLLDQHIDKTWQLSGMLVGIFTGGMANMQAIGMALGADESLFVLINAGDIFAGGLYLILLTSVLHSVLGKFLPHFQYSKQNTTVEETINSDYNWREMLQAVLLTVVIVGAAAGITYGITGAVKSVSLIILLLTTFSVAASFSTKIRHWSGSFQMGEYLLLIFCVAIGMQANLSDIMAQGTDVIFYTSVILFGTAFFHILLCWVFKIDRDTTMITATAAIYGPVFIGQVASAIQNRTLVFSGIATGLVGYALGNYLGIGIGNLLRLWLG